MIAMRRLQSQNVRIGMRFLLAGQGEIDGILQGPPHRTYVEIGGLVAIVVLVEGKATARHIDGVQGDSEMCIRDRGYYSLHNSPHTSLEKNNGNLESRHFLLDRYSKDTNM